MQLFVQGIFNSLTAKDNASSLPNVFKICVWNIQIAFEAIFFKFFRVLDAFHEWHV